MGASTDAGEVGTLAVSLPGLATRRVARTTVSPQCRTRPHRWEQHGEGRRHPCCAQCWLRQKVYGCYNWVCHVGLGVCDCKFLTPCGILNYRSLAMSKSNGRDLSHHDSGCCDRQNPLTIHSIPITTERFLVGFWVFLPTHRALFHQVLCFT